MVKTEAISKKQGGAYLRKTDFSASTPCASSFQEMDPVMTYPYFILPNIWQTFTNAHKGNMLRGMWEREQGIFLLFISPILKPIKDGSLLCLLLWFSFPSPYAAHKNGKEELPLNLQFASSTNWT